MNKALNADSLFSESQERVDNIKLSVEKAKEAVSLDISDGVSWCKYTAVWRIGSLRRRLDCNWTNWYIISTDILGNAYLSLFFSGAQSPGMLKQCLAAYARAVSTKNILHLIYYLFLLFIRLWYCFSRKWTLFQQVILTCILIVQWWGRILYPSNGSWQL